MDLLQQLLAAYRDGYETLVTCGRCRRTLPAFAGEVVLACDDQQHSFGQIPPVRPRGSWGGVRNLSSAKRAALARAGSG